METSIMQLPLVRSRFSRIFLFALCALPLVAPGAYTQKVVDAAINGDEPTPVVQAQKSGGGKTTKTITKTMTSAPKAQRNAPAAAYTNSTDITITDCPSPCPASGQAASLYPSPITVVGEVGVVQR